MTALLPVLSGGARSVRLRLDLNAELEEGATATFVLKELHGHREHPSIAGKLKRLSVRKVVDIVDHAEDIPRDGTVALARRWL